MGKKALKITTEINKDLYWTATLYAYTCVRFSDCDDDLSIDNHVATIELAALTYKGLLRKIENAKSAIIEDQSIFEEEIV